MTFGILMGLAGIAILVYPGATALVLSVIFALALLIHGVYRLVSALEAEEVSGGGRVLMALLGVLSIVVGLLFLRHPFQTLAVLTLLVGVYWIVAGALEIIHAAGAKDMRGRGWAVGAGVLSLVAGIVVLAFPAVSLFALIWLFGIQLLIYGGITIARGFQVRHVEHAAVPPPAPSAGQMGAAPSSS